MHVDEIRMAIKLAFDSNRTKILLPDPFISGFPEPKKKTVVAQDVYFYDVDEISQWLEKQ